MTTDGAVITRSDMLLRSRVKRVKEYYRRKDKNPVKMARLFRDLITEIGYKQVSWRTGIGEGSISNYTSLLRLPDRIRNDVRDGVLPYKAGRSLARLETQEQVRKYAEFIKKENLNGAESERLLTMARQHPTMLPVDVRSLMQNKPSTPAEDAPPRVKNFARVAPPEIPQVSPAKLLECAGYVEMLRPKSDLERMPILTALRTLQKRVDAKLKELE